MRLSSLSAHGDAIFNLKNDNFGIKVVYSEKM